jgi:hypothetical protein
LKDSNSIEAWISLRAEFQHGVVKTSRKILHLNIQYVVFEKEAIRQVEIHGDGSVLSAENKLLIKHRINSIESSSVFQIQITMQ